MKSLNDEGGGDHYKKHGDLQPWNVLEKYLTPEEFHGFMKGSAIVYLLREGDKGGFEDIRKAEHYLKAMCEFKQKREKDSPAKTVPVYNQDYTKGSNSGYDY